MTVPSDRLAGALQTTGAALHDIVSRTDAGQVALEVQRLNDAVRRAAAGRVGPFAQPADFAAMLLAHADPCNDPQAR
jgi:hypothetical protein